MGSEMCIRDSYKRDAPLSQRIAPIGRPSPSRLRRATSPEGGGFGRGVKFLGLSADFFLPLTGVDETCWFCQGLSPSKDFPRPGEDVAGRRQKGELLSSAARLRGFVPEETPSVISLCEMPPPPKVEALAEA